MLEQRTIMKLIILLLLLELPLDSCLEEDSELLFNCESGLS